MNSRQKVVITGMGVVTPLGSSLNKFWQALLSGKNGTEKISFFDASPFSTQIAAEVKDFHPEEVIDKKELRRMDRFVQFSIVATNEAIQDAKLNLEQEDPHRIGVIIGSGIGGIETLENQHKRLIESGPNKITPFLIPMMIIDMASGLISIRLGLKGPNYAAVSACASSAHAIADAYMILQRGDADIMITGGSEACITPLTLAGFCAARAMSTRNDEPARASRPFDKERDGFVLGEGAGILILETLEHAINRNARIYAEIVGVGMTADAYHITAPAPGGEGAIRSMKLSLKENNIAPEKVDYINAHGTSTDLNDKLETQAIKSLFGEHAYKLAVSSIKSMIGHLIGAAGAVELIATVLSIHNNIIPPTINYEYPDPDCDLDYVPNYPRNQPVNLAISNSFGFGGHNITIAVRKLEQS